MSLQSEIKQFTGGDEFYSHWTKRIIYTEEIQFIAEKYGAYWFIDVIASYQKVKNKEGEVADFQVWELKLDKEGSGCVITCKEDSGEPDLIKQIVPFTDFPEDITVWVEGNTLLLPSEH
jgi:hypothetical protein